MTPVHRHPRAFAGIVGPGAGPASGADPGAGPPAGGAAVVRVRSGTRHATVYGTPRLGDAAAADGERAAAALIDAWSAEGERLAQSLSGAYLLALVDDASGDGLLVVDRFSTYPLFWAQTARGVAYATTPARVLELAGRAAEVDPSALLAYVYFHEIPSPLSVFRGVQRLENGTALRVRAGRGEVVRHWTPRFEERRPFDFETERGAFLDALRGAVRRSTEGLGREEVGCFLSGGTDSSTIAGLVGERFGGAARTFSIAFDVGAYDERRYSRLAASHFGTEHTEYVLTPDDVADGIAAIAADYEQPFGNSSAVPTFVCARLGRGRGVSRMLGGDGGDELYGGNERYAKQAVFALYGAVPAALRRGMLEPLLRALPQAEGLPLLPKARSYVAQANEPLPDRLQSRYNLLNWLGASNVFTPGFLDAVDVGGPLALEREVWSRCDAPSQLNRLLAYDFKFTLADNDLPKVTRMCHAAGVDVAFPMLDRAVVDHSLRLDPRQKLKGRTLRHFFRESLRGFLPDEIIDKPKHGFGMPFGEWVMTHPGLRAIADDALASLASRRLVRDAFIDELRQRVAGGHPGYFGTMVWVLTILELWLRGSPASGFRL